MKEFAFYALEANLYLAIFAAFYSFAFRKEQNYVANRIVLVSSLILAWIIPSLTFSSHISPALPTAVLDTIYLSGQAVLSPILPGAYTFTDGLVFLYFTGVLIGLFLFVLLFARTIACINSGRKQMVFDLTIVETETTEAWSFFNVLVIGKAIPVENRNWILEHETVHAIEKHSLDRLLMTLVKISGWFNPAVYYLNRALIENHEYRADEVVCTKIPDSTTYARVLVSQSMGGIPLNLIGHEFSKKSLLKSRIQMINQSKPKGKMKYLLTIPVLAVALLFHSCTKEDPTSVPEPDSSTKAISYDQNTPEGVYEVVDKMPEFKGGVNELMAFMAENTVYPKSAKAADESGKVFVKFIIDKGGNVTKPEVLQDISANSAALHAASINTVSKMPAWSPGEHKGKKVKVQMIIPIKFELK